MEILQTAYIEQLVAKFSYYLPGNYKEKCPPTPMKESTKMSDLVSDHEWELSKHLPYPSVVCAMNYVVTCTKLEMGYAQSKFASKMQRWSRDDFCALMYGLWYMWGRRMYGCLYHGGYDEHGLTLCSRNGTG